MGIREITLERTLYLEIVALNQILGRRIFGTPGDYTCAGIAAVFILLRRCLKIIDAVVGRNMYGIRMNGLYISGFLVAIDLEGGIKRVVPRVGSRYIHRTAVLLDLHRFIGKRMGIGYRFGLRIIGNSRQSATSSTRLIDHVKIRRIELRSRRVITTGEGGGESEERIVVRT